MRLFVFIRHLPCPTSGFRNFLCWSAARLHLVVMDDTAVCWTIPFVERKCTPLCCVWRAKRKLQGCKYFSQQYLLCNYLITSALQNLLFCVPKAAVLHGKSVGFALQKSRFRNVKAQLSLFKGIILTKQGLQYVFSMAKMWGHDSLMQAIKKNRHCKWMQWRKMNNQLL